MPHRQYAIRLCTGFDLKQLRGLIDFANLDSDSISRDRVHKLFPGDPDQYFNSGQRARVPLGRWKDSPEDLKGLQREMRKWLDQITAEKYIGPEIGAEVDRWLNEVRTSGPRAAGGGGVTVSLNLDTPRARCMYAIFLLRDIGGLVKQLARCLHCGHYLFDERIRTGPRNKFCRDTYHKSMYHQYRDSHDGKPRPLKPLP